MAAGSYVGVMVIGLHFPEADSLKGRRRELAPVKTFLHSRMGMTVAETGYQEKWQRATLTAALTSGSPAVLEDAISGATRWLEARFPDGVTVDRIVLSTEDVFG
jgi:uncharacterized protein YlxP (DUF503 family)